MKKLSILFILILFIASTFLWGHFIVILKTRLFVGEFGQDINKKHPFILIPNDFLKSSEEQIKFLGNLFNFQNITLKEESKELKWEPIYKDRKTYFPKITQDIKLEDNEYQMTLIPTNYDNLKRESYRIKIFLIKSVGETQGSFLRPLKLIYDDIPSKKILDVEVKKFGNLIFIFIPFGKKVYIVSISQIYMFGGPV